MTTSSKSSTSTMTGMPDVQLTPLQQIALLRLAWVLTVLATPVLTWVLPAFGVVWTPPPTLLLIIQVAAGIGGLVVAAELAGAAIALVGGRYKQHRAQRRVLRIRTPNPQITKGTMGLNTPDGTELWYSLNQLQQEGEGRGGWHALTLAATPDNPVGLYAVVGTTEQGKAGDERLSRAATALRQVITGINTEAEVSAVDDPLEASIQQAASANTRAVLMWREYRLLCGPDYPLRTPADADSDLMAPLVAAIRPKVGAVRFAEAQIITKMRQDWRMDDASWRAAARYRLDRLRDKKQGGVLTGDGKALEQKLDGPAGDTTLRVVVLAETKNDASSLFEEVAVALGTFARRSGHRQQRWKVAASGTIPLHRLAPIERARWATARTLAPGVLAALALLIATALGGIAAHIGIPLALAVVLAAAAADRKIANQPARDQVRRLQARAPRIVPPQTWLAVLPWRAPAVLSASELGGLWHLPSPNQGGLVRWLPSRQLRPPREAFIDQPYIVTNTGMRSPRIAFALATRSDGNLAPVGPSLYDIRNICHGTAGMGAGKSQFLANFCRQCIPHGFTLIDGKGDDAGNLTNTVRKYIPLEDEHRLVIINIADTDWPISLNPLSGFSLEKTDSVDRLTSAMQSIFARIDPETWSSAPGMQQFLEMGTRLVVETVERPTILHIKQALLDEKYREQIIGKCKNLDVKTFWTVVYPSSSEQQKTSLNALMRRFDKLVLSDVVRLLMTQEISTLKFRDAIEEKLIVLCPIPHVTYGPLAATAAMLIFQSILRAAFERPGTAATRADYPLVIDEFQVLVDNGATQDVETAVGQLRSQGIPTLYFHQAMAQIGDLREMMLINAENRMLFRTQEPDASLYARHYTAAGLTGADVANQAPREHVYLRFPVAGVALDVMSGVPLPWPQPLTILLDEYTGPHWQTLIPPPPDLPALPGPVDPELAAKLYDYDRDLLTLVYQTPYSTERAMRMAESLSEEEWLLMTMRWKQIARYQRQYILDHPNCIPDRFERQEWLVRLRYAPPRILAEIEGFRIRRASGSYTIAPSAKKDKGDKSAGGSRGAKGGKDDSTKLPDNAPNPDQRQHWTTNVNQPPPPNDDPTKVEKPVVRA